MCKKELKIHQKKGERERERERYFTFLCRKIWIEWKREKKIFIVNKMGRRKFKIKGR